MTAFLEIMDSETGRVHCLLETERHIEAPNWAPSGDALIVNAAGRAYHVVIGAPSLQEIDTGFAQLNNDKGLSPDGTLLAFSDKTETGKSCIYTVPAGGGTPRRITQEVPSWWHGFSPDGARHTYACVRDDQFGIATCARDGGDEQLLITSRHHYDGPDYTPDGAFIWFNSDLSGTMDLWRMAADGSNPERMTHGPEVDWFPHPSPNGRHVLYIAYPAGTEGHPFGVSVTLKLMPSGGGAPRVLGAIFGGQGALNVPPWAPDGRHFAYVRYSEDHKPET
ncbi:PD40 domain-containing protein [Pacificoceanicola onchidii]|uniref:PD40 domain-containing protein n=1 Tax=Pacificoceanicola onchidii TaxID=2562685 RepID=UPI0010A38CF5|nr:PD40 domain-containing protein [Pacificoceanicola onchidii]